MKKHLLAFALTGLLASQAVAINMATGTHTIVSGDIEWNIIDDYSTMTTTYWTKITGNYNIDLGIASITTKSAGTLSVYTTNTDWTTNLGLGLTSNTDPYQVRTTDPGDGAQDPHTALYVDHPVDHTKKSIEFRINHYNYVMNGGDTPAYEAKDGTVYVTTMPDTVYSTEAMNSSPDYWNNQAVGTMLTFGYTLSAATDENGNITGLRFTAPEEFLTPDWTATGLATEESLETGEGVQVNLELDAWLDSEGNYVDLPNMGHGFDLTNLVSYGVSTIDTGESYGLDDNAVTYIVITKELRPEAIPEPATATLSLLALAGLAARRRRK